MSTPAPNLGCVLAEARTFMNFCCLHCDAELFAAQLAQIRVERGRKLGQTGLGCFVACLVGEHTWVKVGVVWV